MKYYPINHAFQSPVPLTGIIDIDQTNVLEETVAFYSKDITRRSVENLFCVYRTKDGHACAIGRLIPDATVGKFKSYGIVCCEGIFFYLPDSVKFLGADFLVDLQRLHDNSSFWSDKGLTAKGKQFYNKIKLGISFKTYRPYIFEPKTDKNELQTSNKG